MRTPAILFAVLAAASFGDESVRAQGGVRQPMAPEDLAELRRVGGLTLSPDGTGLLYSVRTPNVANNTSIGAVFYLPTDRSSTPLQVASGGAPAWVGNGAFSAISDGTLMRIPMASGSLVRPPQIDQFELPAGATNVQWSPDGTAIAFTRAVLMDPPVTATHQDLPKANARAYEDLMVRHWDRWNDGTFSHLFVQRLGAEPVDLMAGERVHTPLPPFGGAEHIAWSPDGKELCYTARRVENPEASTDSQLWVVRVDEHGRAPHRCITPNAPGYDVEPVYSPDGRWIVYSSMARPGFEADRNRVMLHDRQTGKNRELLPGFDASPHELSWTEDSKHLFFTVDTRGTTQLYTCEVPDSGASKAVAVTKGRHRLSGPQVAPDGEHVYALMTKTERAAEVVSVDVRSGGITQITNVNGDAYARFSPITVDEEWFDATDGQKIHSWIIKPPGFDPQKKYPFLLYCQGGPQSQVGQWYSFRWNFHLMASQGYVVAAVNRRGLPGFGQAWNDQISRDWGGQAMQDLLSVCDAMQARDYIDRERSAAIGASFGGYTVYWLMGNAGDRFACMVSHCGVFNLESMYLATEELFFVNWDLGGPFWASPEVAAGYRRFSPHRYVKNWRTPLLVIHGEKDFRVPYDQGLQAFTAAQVMGVESRLLMFPEEGHWVLSPQNGVLWQREFYGWLARFCKDDDK
ncbi:MAG: S9 family peptidase [bacterium]|nr:S9 family peptidase [bacterium]